VRRHCFGPGVMTLLVNGEPVRLYQVTNLTVEVAVPPTNGSAVDVVARMDEALAATEVLQAYASPPRPREAQWKRERRGRRG
jgi:hypothetical protein